MSKKTIEIKAGVTEKGVLERVTIDLDGVRLQVAAAAVLGLICNKCMKFDKKDARNALHAFKPLNGLSPDGIELHRTLKQFAED